MVISVLRAYVVVDLLFIVTHIAGVLCLLLGLLCSVFSCFVIILMGKRESWLLYYNCLPDVLSCKVIFCDFSSHCHGSVRSV